MVGKVGKAVAAGVGGTILLINVCWFKNWKRAHHTGLNFGIFEFFEGPIVTFQLFSIR